MDMKKVRSEADSSVKMLGVSFLLLLASVVSVVVWLVVS